MDDSAVVIILVVFALVLFVAWLRRSTGPGDERRLVDLEQAEARLSRQVAELTQRLYLLEQRGAAPGAASAPAPAPLTTPPVGDVEALPPLPVFEPAPPPLPVELPNLPPEPPPLPPAPPEPTWGELIRERYQGEEWEAIVGGSLLNKLGALMLVIGVALFLGYSLTHLGPLGKVSVGIGVCAVMLGAGIFLERQPRYKIFARGFLGGGWALLYFTAYAMHGLPAARVIESPAAGFALLLTVAAGMVLHSLLYRSEVITALTFFIAFFTLTLFPPANYGLVASVVLTAFLLVVAYRFQWAGAVVAGLVYAYGAHLVQFDLRSDPRPDAWVAAAVLWSYWLLFEAYDLLHLRRQPNDRGLLRTILPLNACGFLGLAFLPNSPVSGAGLSGFLALAALATFGSALLRAGSLRPSEEEESKPFLVALLAGGFESAITITTLATLAAILVRFTGTALKVAVVMEGEMLVLSGLALGRRYLRQIGAGVLALAFARIYAVDIEQNRTREFFGLQLRYWTPSALAVAAIYYFNRWVTRATPLYTWGAALLLVAVLTAELRELYIGLSWMLLGSVLLVMLRWWREVRWQSVGLITVGYFGLLFDVVVRDPERATSWVAAAGVVLLVLLTAVGWRFSRDRLGYAMASSSAATLLAMAWVWRAMPDRSLAVGWILIAVVLVELGVRIPWAWLRYLAVPVSICVTFAGLYSIGVDPELWWGFSHRYLVAIPVIALLYYLAERTAGLDGLWGVLYQFLGSSLALALIGQQAGEQWAAAGFAAFGMVLLAIGAFRPDPFLRLQGDLVLAIAFLWALFTAWQEPHRLARLVPVIAALYAAQFLTPRQASPDMPDWLAWLAPSIRRAMSLAATLLVSVLLWFEVSGQRLTVAWGLQGVVLLTVGFMVRERILRLSGLALFLLCIAKLFIYDMRNLETLSRILSFIVLGLLLLGASWIYTRFRDQVRKLL